MRSTGEVMGLDTNLGIAYAKSQMAAGCPLPTGGKVFISVTDADKPRVPAVAKLFADLGFEIVSTGRTAQLLEATGLKLAPPAEPFEIDQKGFRFIPHVLVVQTGSTIRFLNNDPEPHNVYSPEGRYNLGTWPTGDTKDYTFKKPGIYSQLCNIHPDMLAWVVVVDTPLRRHRATGATSSATCLPASTGWSRGTRRRTASSRTSRSWRASP
jgi:plastocyanin